MAMMTPANPKQSCLESLPTELLEQIFLQSLNVNLPLASSHLGTALSSTRTKMVVVWKVFPNHSGAFDAEDYAELSEILQAGDAGDTCMKTEIEIGKLQSRILACRWMTWDFLKLCMETFVVRTLLREFRVQNLPWQEELPVKEQPYNAVMVPWHGGAPVKDSVVRDFVHEVFALKVHLGIRCEENLDDCEYTEDELKTKRENFRKGREEGANIEANGEEKEIPEELESGDTDSDENFDRGYQRLGVDTRGWIPNEDHTGYGIKDVSITPSLRTCSWGPLDGTPRVSVGIDPRNGVVFLRTWLKCENDSRMIQTTRRRWRCLWCDFHPNIPVKLLHGPWTENQLSFLQVLIEGGAKLSPDKKAYGKIAKNGLMEAIREDNCRAVDLLVIGYEEGHGDDYFQPGLSELEFAMNLEGDFSDWIRSSTKRRTVGIEPDTEHLKLAVIERGCRRNIVRRLLWAKLSGIDRANPAVVDWAEMKKEQGDIVGEWLLDQLTRSARRYDEVNDIVEQPKERYPSYDSSISARGSNDGTRSPIGKADAASDQEESRDDTH